MIIYLKILGTVFLACILTGCSQYKHSDTNEIKISLSDEELMNLVQEKTFQYFWTGAEHNSGLARERIHIDGIYPQKDTNVITSGGSGFGLMAIIVGIERGFITRDEGVRRIEKILNWLEKAERFHGVYSHWLYGNTGKVKPFSRKDNGGDIVETAFLFQGLLTLRQYLKEGNNAEVNLAQRIDLLWKEVDWNFYRGDPKENVLFWHWSPEYLFEMQHRISGYNECLIAYVIAASSPTYPIPPEVYHDGWARSGQIKDTVKAYGHLLELEHRDCRGYGGPLFWAHYTYLGLDPRNLKDQYASYWRHNVNHSKINYKYCIENPKNYSGYGPNCWGLTSSYSLQGYAGHKPARDYGVIAPTAALSSIPYTPQESLAAMRYFYEELGESLWGPYGFYDAFSQERDYFPRRYLAIDQGPIVIMIENYRTGMLWDLFMSCPEIQEGLKKLEFSF